MAILYRIIPSTGQLTGQLVISDLQVPFLVVKSAEHNNFFFIFDAVLYDFSADPKIF